ncbi:phage head-tail adapter protein [Acinetobacter baumannii]|uniref:phage head completion protein n=1 Tax=Acinetobacter baumannii TaxID=470 RepID=UPI0009283B44|nr:head-tail adaptor protein [Acinetobacter baumannii]OJK08891.1 phage head-tail adapter protein [Acinetobacter baumannii]
MQSGKLDVLFDVLERTTEKNSAGETKQIWSIIGQFYGDIEPISAANFVQSGIQGSALVCRVVLRPDDFPNIKAAFLLRDVDTNDIYAINGVLPITPSKKALMCSLGKL